MKRILFSDIETTKFKDNLIEFDDISYELNFKLGCIQEYDYDNENPIYSFHTTNQELFLSELISDLSLRKTKIIYFHNLTFDSKFFIDKLNSFFDNVKIIRTSSKILSIKCYKTRSFISNNKRKNRNDCLLEFRDSLALLVVSIEKLGNMVNLEKLDFDFDYSNEIQLKKAIDYCFTDCKIIFKSIKFLLNFLNDTFFLNWNLSDIPLTIASLSKKLIKLFYPNIFYRNDKYNESKLRKYYFGGRTEVFNFNLLEKGKYVDINSAYPSVMVDSDLSYGKTYIFKTNKLEFENKECLAMELTIIENNFYPLFPVKINGKILFVNGLKKVLMSKKEYFWLKKYHYFDKKLIEIKKIHSVLITNKKCNMSLLYLNLYNLRKSYEMKFGKDYPYVFFIKILLNSGYGKFGEKVIKKNYEFINDITDIDFDNDNINDINNCLLREKETYQIWLENNLINAILITSYVRFKIFKMLELCRKHNIIVYYTDTDSIVIQNKNLAKLSKYISNKLGKWSIEQEFDVFQAIDSKEYYSVDNKRKIPFLAKFKGVKNDYLKDKDSLLQHIKEGTKVNLVGSFFYCMKRKSDSKSVFVITKHKKSFYCKRTINSDLSTIPNEIDDNLEFIESINKKLILNHLKGKSST